MAMSSTSEYQNGVHDAARGHVRRWLTSPGLRQFLEEAPDLGRRLKRTGPYLAISREPGCGGGRIAREIAERLGWDMLDKELLDFIAERYGVARAMLEFVDETSANWLRDSLGSLMDPQFVSHEKFVACLRRVILLAAVHGRIVFVGRGAHRILPRASGMAVRLIAPLEFRIARTMEQRGLSRRQARRRIAEIESHRIQFYRRYFHQKWGETHGFDLTINVARFASSDVGEMIVHALRCLCGDSVAAAKVDA
ncbi:MAG: cytidylate kinase-like family protein [Planctomycetes bacterium]|nr:cytidylate kinase-like family protein [Planctomycetota bacterium]